mmetsp:Transcript_3915/g.9326  ORF Transcript_3915/g.9326 Transcript_3915/m.9326 type:complete len:221 (-) Transcript_3915:417-1079(-)
MQLQQQDSQILVVQDELCISKDDRILVVLVSGLILLSTAGHSRFFHGGLACLFELVLTVSKHGTEDRVCSCDKQIVFFQALESIVVSFLGDAFSTQFVTQDHGTGVIFACDLILHLFHRIVCQHPSLIGLTFGLGFGIGGNFGLLHQERRPLVCPLELFQDGLSLVAPALLADLVRVRPRALGADQQMPQNIDVWDRNRNSGCGRFALAAFFCLDDDLLG